MKKNTNLFRIVLVLSLVFTSLNSWAQTIASYDFESGLQSWTDGGSDSGLNTDPVYAANGNQSIYSKDDDTSNNYTTSPTLNLSSYSSIDFSFSFIGRGLDTGEGFSVEYYNGSSWSTLKTYALGTDFTSNNLKYEFYITVTSGLSSTSQFRFTSNADSNWEYSYFDDVIVKVSEAEIDIQGNAITIADGDATPNNSDHTHFGTANFGTQISRTYIINNYGGADLNITSIVLSNTTDFSIIAPFYSSPVVATSGSTTFTIQFNSASLGTKTSTVTVSNDDSDEGTYTFEIEARAEQNFFDSDGDGVLDNVDIDDDNDGIEDGIEETSCKNSATATTTNYKFLNETFGEGNRTTINTTYDAITTYCYEDGTVGTNVTECPSLSNMSLNDGEYTVYYKAGDGDGTDDTPNGEVASWADDYWYTGEDHTSGDTNGRMAMFNASYDPGTFYTATIIGALPNVPITYSFWVLNLDTTTAPGIATRLRPNILVEFRDVNNNVLASITTGDIDPSINGDAENSWHQFTADLTFNVSEFYVYFINNEVGGAGNDLAIDDIVISQTLCDTDGDGVADVFDLDSDNDGIPDVVETGLGSYSEGNATLTGSSSWVDSNGNGMYDLAEGTTPIDSDGDSVPNHLDLDSDNDTIFDVDESGAGNSADTNYQNGDGDVTGDGVGDGTDTDTVRETDINSDGTIEYFTDGILDLYDFFEGSSMSTGFGNSNQGTTGTGWEYYVVDTDNDGTPDYLDTTSDGSTYDISHTLYASLDGNNDGIIDDTSDTEGDGILDLFDTNDAVFGSPRDLNDKFLLYFDGRNDYADESTVIDEWSGASLMTWLKIDPSSTGEQFIMGQDEFYLKLNTDKTVSAYADSKTVKSSSALTTNYWVHIAATYSSSNSLMALYVNGEQVSTTAISGALNSDSSSFTLGRAPDTSDKYFHGCLDEVRVFNKALSANELRKMIYQEIEENAGNVKGVEIPRDITDFVSPSTETPLPWSNLVRYYRMDTYKDDIIDDVSTTSIDTDSGTKIYNVKTIDKQTAPLPFTTHSDGDLPTAVDVSGDGVNGNDAITYDWSIVKIQNENTHYNSTQKHLALIVDATDASTSNPIVLTVGNDSELNVSWYLKLDGKIDLEGESQLVQGEESYLDPTSSGTLEKDQQGTADTYTYNYWSSPVGLSNGTTNNNAFTAADIFTNVTFTSSGYDGSASPLTLADYWIWKFSNKTSGSYSQWQHARSTGSILPGEGFTMKGPGSGGISTDQNYVLEGKPNNGDINLSISAGNDYLVGNPYPSAIDAHQFILDNGPVIDSVDVGPTINGTLYFWEHWGGGSHLLREYQGGYATYSLSGSTPAASKGTNDPDVGTGGVPTKLPGRYIPVAQGFFVTGESSGTIQFNNGQRVFQTEDGTNSLFVKTGNTKKTASNSSKELDTRIKLRLGFNSVNGIHRQLLATVDSLASEDYDWGFDAPHIDEQMDDMYWLIDDKKYTIQGIDTFDATIVIPFGIHTKTDGQNLITIDKLENFPSDKDIYLHDKELDIYHDLRESDYSINVPAGSYLNRFEITFAKSQTLSTSDIIDSNNIEIFYSNENETIVINNPTAKNIKVIEMFSILGQSLFSLDVNSNETNINYKATKIATGNYIIKIETEYGVISKKVLVQ
ncbi:MAG: LamG-like jellyroll fold domain-containing protein [Jejuia sp.]